MTSLPSIKSLQAIAPHEPLADMPFSFAVARLRRQTDIALSDIDKGRLCAHGLVPRHSGFDRVDDGRHSTQVDRKDAIFATQ